MSGLPEEEIRACFPALSRTIGGRPVVFADNAATSLKPRCVIDAVTGYYSSVSSNVHRGANALADEAGELYEGARRTVAELIGARAEEIVFVRNTTEAINLAGAILGLGGDDEVICSAGDHHSNILPWRARAAPRLIDPAPDGRIRVDAFLDAMGPRTRLVALTHASNLTGLVNPLKEVIGEARRRGIPTIVDGAQSIPHLPVDVRDLGCDMLAFSGHKMLGPTGTGVLYCRREILESGRPMLHGGGMVRTVTTGGHTLADVPHRYEAGTPCIEGAIGLARAVEFLRALGMERVRDHAFGLARTLVGGLLGIRGIGIRPVDVTGERLPIVSFSVRGLNADDVAEILCNRHNIMVRSGVHCAEPLVRHFGEAGLVRISLQVYNTAGEIASLVAALEGLSRAFS